jgi:hypothetical protein
MCIICGCFYFILFYAFNIHYYYYYYYYCLLFVILYFTFFFLSQMLHIASMCGAFRSIAFLLVNNVSSCIPLIKTIHDAIEKNTCSRNDKLRKWISDKVYRFALTEIGLLLLLCFCFVFFLFCFFLFYFFFFLFFLFYFIFFFCFIFFCLELFLVFCGEDEFDVNEWEENTIYRDYTKSSDIIKWYVFMVGEINKFCSVYHHHHHNFCFYLFMTQPPPSPSPAS